MIFAKLINLLNSNFLRKLNGFAFDKTPRGIATRTFIDYVEKESNGRLKIESFPIESYGTENEMIEAVQKGALDMQIVGANMLANTIPPFAALSLPYLTENFDEGLAILDGSVGDHLKNLSNEYGFKVLGDVALGYAQITNNIRPINSPDDLLGMKMRSPNEFSFVETFKAFGSLVSTMGYEETYKGLAQGSIDGQFNPLSNIFDLGTFAVAFLVRPIGGFIFGMLGDRTMPALLPSLFFTEVRYGALAITYNLSVSLFGGSTPLLVALLIKETNNRFVPAYYLMGACAIGFLVISFFVKETSGRSLRGSAPAVEGTHEIPDVLKAPEQAFWWEEEKHMSFKNVAMEKEFSSNFE